jgi:hypothetical protein
MDRAGHPIAERRSKPSEAVRIGDPLLGPTNVSDNPVRGDKHGFTKRCDRELGFIALFVVP